MCGSMPYLRAQWRMYSQISGWGENVCDQSGFGSNENEYRCEGTSQRQPGYVLSRQVPPRSPAFSRTTKSSMPASRSLIAMPTPAKPVAMTRTPWWGTGAGVTTRQGTRAFSTLCDGRHSTVTHVRGRAHPRACLAEAPVLVAHQPGRQQREQRERLERLDLQRERDQRES